MCHVELIWSCPAAGLRARPHHSRVLNVGERQGRRVLSPEVPHRQEGHWLHQQVTIQTYRVGLKGLQVFEISHYWPIAERFCDVARTVHIFCECNVAKTFCNRPYSAAKGEKPAQSAYLPFSERLMKNLATPFKPFSQTLYPGLNSKLGNPAWRFSDCAEICVLVFTICIAIGWLEGLL